MDLKEETRRLVTEYDPRAPDDTAAALEALWSLVPAKEGGARLVKAEIREKLRVIGVPVPALSEIGKEIGKVARKRVDDFLPLARLLWDDYGREGRLVACTFLGPMELAAPDQIMPAIEDMR